MSLKFDESTKTVQNLMIVFGGMGPSIFIARKTAKSLVGRNWDHSLLSDASSLLSTELSIVPMLTKYKKTLATSFFFKFFLTVEIGLKNKGTANNDPTHCYDSSAIRRLYNEPYTASQLFQEVPSTQPKDDSIGRPIAHMASALHATGEAVYCDDIPSFKGELYVALVLSTKPHAKILNTDPCEALDLTGVAGFLSQEDVPGSNSYRNNHDSETVFANERVYAQGQVIGAIVANSKTLAQKAAGLIKVSYSELKPIVSIQDAIAAKSYHCPSKCLETGNIDVGFRMSDHILEGEMSTGGQKHFYMETNAVLVIPKRENAELEVICSTQHIAGLQTDLVTILDIPANRITCKVKRMGGSFGGKIYQPMRIAGPAAVAAIKYNKPVRCVLDRDEDMLVIGGRHPFYFKYKVGFSKEGKIISLVLEIFSNGGYSMDCSDFVTEYAIYHCDGLCKIPNLKVIGHVCKTNVPSNTAFRGYGETDVNVALETMIHEIASNLNIPPEMIHEMNMYKEGDLTHYGMKLENFPIQQCWEECMIMSNFYRRKEEVDKFNRENRWKKRGICILPCKHGICYSKAFLNQAGALVHAYRDGSVLLTHGGIEMGQGLHTKMIQVASKVLEIPCSKILISETCTSKIPNATQTSAGSGTDLNGMAVLNACQTIRNRLEPYRKKEPRGNWVNWVEAAYLDRISLSSTGFYKLPGTAFDWTTKTGNPYSYFGMGVGCTEVEIDCLTGDHQVMRTDLVVDVGKSLNPAIDIGQIEGSYVQGLGWCTIENVKISDDGFVQITGPNDYKIPTILDIPKEFNVSLLKNRKNERAVYSSKGIGETAFSLSQSAFFAIKYAISAARKNAGVQATFVLEHPATAEIIRMACIDHFTNSSGNKKSKM